MDDAWIPIILFGSIAVVMGLWLYFRYRSRQAVQQTVRAAIEKGQELSPELLESLGQPKVSGDADLRRGVVSLAIGIAFGILAVVISGEEPDAFRPILGAASFPATIGVAYLALWLFAGKKDA